MIALVVLALAGAPVHAIVARGAIQPQLCAAPDGTFYCTFLADGNAFVSRSDDGGSTWGTPVVAIDADHRMRGGMQRGPRVGADAHQHVYVSAPVHLPLAGEDEGADGPPDLWLAASSDGGRSFAAPARVNDPPGKAPEGLHWLAVASDGGVSLAWLDLRGTAHGQDLYFASVTGGRPGANVRIAEALCECCAPGLCAGTSGEIALAFREGGHKPSRAIRLVTSRDRGATWGDARRVNASDTKLATCPMDAPAVALSRDGKKSAVAWMDLRAGPNDRNVYCAIASGGPLAREQPLGTTSNGYQGHPSLAFDPAGELHAVWEDARDGQQRIFHSRPATGSADAALSTAADGKASFPSIACGKVIGVAYETDEGIVFRSVDEQT